MNDLSKYFDNGFEAPEGSDEDEFALIPTEWYPVEITKVEIKEVQVRAYSEDDYDDENYEVKVFVRVTYKDIDESDDDKVYVVVTSVLDEGDYDNLSIEEVTRSFEFE